jgi:uncharacterized protein YndB with AHSA1/START domain
MNIAELSRIDRAVEIQAPPERVWRALTDASELAEWMQVQLDRQFAVGHEVWMTSTNAAYAGHRFRVHIVEMTPPRRLVWKWHPGEVDPNVDYSKEPQTIVTFTLEASGRGTKLSVAETGFDEISLARRAKVYGDNVQGWVEVVALLQRHVEAKA